MPTKSTKVKAKATGGGGLNKKQLTHLEKRLLEERARVIKELQGATHGAPNPFAELSDRELEVLRLIASGLSNADIAARLVLSEKTVKGHVGNILGKLQLADRTQAAVLAWREGIAPPD